MEYIMGYNVKKENYVKRVKMLVEYLMEESERERHIGTKDSIGDIFKEKEIELGGSGFLEWLQFLLEDIYIYDICEHQLYFDWFYYYNFAICNIEEFILECDGFFSYLAIYEIIEDLERKSKKQNEIKDYMGDNKIIELKNNLKEIMDVFSMRSKDTPSWAISTNYYYNTDSIAGGKCTNWEDIDGLYFIGYLINEIASDIVDFEGCKELSEALKELEDSILPENTLKSEDIEGASNKASKIK